MTPLTRQNALANGLKHYFTGKPCKHGHIATRFASTKQCSECVKAYYKQWKAENRSDHLEWRRSHRQKNDTPEQRKADVARATAWRLANKDRRAEWRRNYRLKREAEDLKFKIQRRLQARLWHAVAKGSKSSSTLELLGCSYEHLLSHLEAQFSPGMSWNNYGEWHIDHIRPCASFDLTQRAQQKDCFNWTNLQPLWAAENIRKGASFS
jgi:hypothetical protein